jgi:hypothetical protein
MLLTLKRQANNSNATWGKLYIKGEFECYTLEDEPRVVKVMGETRINAGTYEIKLRIIGSHHIKYKVRFPEFHKGMLQLINVQKFTGILIHIGNTEKDTAGCILVGSAVTKEFRLVNSTAAYIKLYKKILPALESEERVFIKITDEG